MINHPNRAKKFKDKAAVEAIKAMAMVTLGEAARLTDLGKTTLARAIKAGRLSATKTDLGSYQIDPAELARVYPFKAPTEATASAAILEAQISGLREVSELLRSQLGDLREDRDRWRTQAEAAQRLIAGDRSAATNTGYQSAATNTGKESVAMASGYQGRVSGADGCALFLVERDDNYKIIAAWAGIVGRDRIKPGVFYTLKDGKPVKWVET